MQSTQETVSRCCNPDAKSKIAALVFGSGRLCSPGKSVESLNKGLEILGDLLRSLNIDIASELTYKIRTLLHRQTLGQEST